MQQISPVQKIQYKGIDILIKRDDLIDPFISGNKWRKLKYILQDVKRLSKTHLVTFGGAYSNHIVATATAAARDGLESTAFVRGESVENEVILLCRLFGMQLIFVSRADYLNKDILFDKYFGNDPSAYFIDEGGAGMQGAAGCAEIIHELPADIDHIFCAAGTGTTAAGLLNGATETRHKAHLHIIPVLKGGAFLREDIAKLSANTDYSMHLDYHFGGYAKTTLELLKFIQDFTQTTGLLIDPVYTAKMFYAIFDLIHKNTIEKNTKILAIHTGGLMGIFGKRGDLFKTL